MLWECEPRCPHGGPCSKPVSPCLAGGTGEREKVPANPEALLLMASSQRDMEDWVQAIRRVIWAPLGGGTARRSHAHPLEPLPSGNHAPPPCTEPTRPLSLGTHWLCPWLLTAGKPCCPLLLPAPDSHTSTLLDRQQQGSQGHLSKHALLQLESCGVCILPPCIQSPAAQQVFLRWSALGPASFPLLCLPTATQGPCAAHTTSALFLS